MKKMNILVLGVLSVFGSLLLVSEVFAGGAVAKRQEAQQKMMQQKKQAQMQQRTLMQQRMQAEAVAQQGAMRQKMQQQQQAVMAREARDRQIIEQTHYSKEMKERELAQQVKDVIDINDLVASFQTSSRAWPLIIDDEAKAVVVTRYIDIYRKEGVTINKSSFAYANMIDGMSQATPEMLNQPLKQVLMILAVLEYDFNNGQNKDDLALKVLGSRQAVMQNKKRLGL